jgi:hypothetical protein
MWETATAFFGVLLPLWLLRGCIEGWQWKVRDRRNSDRTGGASHGDNGPACSVDDGRRRW